MGFWWEMLRDCLGTLLAAAIGIPVGLYLNRKAQQIAARRAGEAEAQRLNAALSILRNSISVNVTGLQGIVTTLEDPTNLSIMPGISAASWLAVRREVVVGLPDPPLRLMLAMFFEEVERLERVNEKLVDYSIGLQSALGGVAHPIRDLLRNSVKEQAATLAKRGQNLLADLDRLIARPS